MADDGVQAAARAVRWFLPELVGPDAESVDEEVADILAEEPGRGDVQRRLRELLERREGTGVFLDAILNDAPEFRPPQARPSTLKEGRLSGLPGRIGAVAAPKYRCPVGNDFDWWQLAEEDLVPVCKSHGCALVRVSG
jgi:hypothetical protein